MKWDMKLPGGWEMHYERHPMARDRFEAVCGICYALIAAGVFIKFVSILF